MSLVAPAVHDVLVQAADIIVANGYCQHYLYSVTQAERGTPLEHCAVDIVGAIGIVLHGTPIHPATDQSKAIERAIADRIGRSITNWCSLPSSSKAQAIRLLRGQPAGGGGMSVLDTARAVVSHRGESALDLKRHIGEQDRELRALRDRADTATRLEARNDEQAQTIHSLRAQLAKALAIKDDTNARAVRCSEAEARAVRSERHMRELDAELMELRAFRDNTLAVSQPAGHRDIDPDDQPTQPVPLWQALGRVVTTPGTANPASIPQRRTA